MVMDRVSEVEALDYYSNPPLSLTNIMKHAATIIS